VSAEHSGENNLKELRRFQTLIKRYPKNSNYYFAAGEVVMAMGMINSGTYKPENLRLAQDLANKGLALDQKADRGWTLLGRIAVQRKDMTAANADYQKALEADAKSHRTLILGGDIKRKSGKLDEALNDFKSAELAAVSTKQKTTAIRKQISTKYEKLFNEKKYGSLEKELVPDLERMIQTDPEDPWNLHNAATEYEAMGNSAKTIELERKALSKMNFGLAREYLSRALTAEALKVSSANGKGNIEQAEKLIQEAAKLDDDSSDIYIQFGVAQIAVLKAEYNKDTSAIGSIQTQVTRLKKLNPEYALIKRIEAGLERLERLKSGRLPANSDA
jgi:tetratricopeptide (TPR) repeat protein